MAKGKTKAIEEEPMEVDSVPPTNDGDAVNNQAGPSNNVILDDDEMDHISDDEEGGIRIGDIYIPPAPKPALSMETKGPRLIITKIVNENFKSYAGVRTLGPFHKSFTAIIGPNGSGKSNVIDSMLFVFGYRATKIRSKKISVLLHSSKKYPNVTSATVAVHFVEIIDKPGSDDEYDIVPGSELVVSRTAFKDNSSFYTLNGRRVQFKEVYKVLKSHGIDLDHNRFLILQGEVEQIAMMKPKAPSEHESGMLEYLEDIIGTSRFKEPIEKLAVRVEELSEARKEKLNRVRLVEGEKQKLEGPMREALDQLNIMNTLTRARNTLIQKYIHQTNKKISNVSEDKDKHQTVLNELDGKMGELKKNKDEKQAQLAKGTKKFEDLERRKEELSELMKKIKCRDVALQADVTQTNKRKKNIQGVLDQEKGKLIDLEQVPEKNKRDIQECGELSVKLQGQKEAKEAELETVMSSIREETRVLQESKDKVQLQLMELKKVEDEKRQIFKLAEAELKLYVSGEDKEKNKLEQLKQSVEQNNLDLQEKKARVQKLSSMIPEKERALQSAKKEFEELKSEDVEVGGRVRGLRGQLEDSKQSLSANKSKGRVLDSLMQQKQNGRLPGIFGRLGDLGGIDEKYDVAISTCCGPLDNIVVDTVDTAQKCIEYLREQNIGRATFIALEKQEHLRAQCDKKITTPENAPRLFDLIRISDERVRPAFYYALRDTLVAKDLDQATRISYGRVRYRVVTLGGDVIEIAGTMSGGGKTSMRGRMGQTVQQASNEVDPRLVAQQEEELADLLERMKELRSRIPELESTIMTLTRDITQLKNEKCRLDVEYKNLVEQGPLLKNQLKEQTAKMSKCVVDPKKKSELDKAMREADLQYEKARLDSEKVDKEVQKIHNQIVEVAGGKVKNLQKQVDELVKKMDKVNGEVTRLKVAISTSERNAKKSREKISQMEKELSELEEKIKTMNEEKKELAKDGAMAEKQIDEITEEISEGSQEFSGLKEEIGQLVKEENKMKAERLEIVNNISKVDKVIDDLKAKIPSWNRELSQLVLESVPIAGQEPEAPLCKYTEEELEALKVEELQNKVGIQEERLGEQKPNLQAIQEYKAKEEVYLKRAEELEEITKRRNDARQLHDDLRHKRHTEFLGGFHTITAKLKEMYQMITLGGDAELELVDSLDPFTEGIVFSVRPPNKSWKNISNLSGGEKTLSSLALVFALHYYKPTPLYVMDEIDAALDFKNVSIVANYIKQRTKNAQFIIISLRYNMFEMANKLVGIYKTNDCTHSITIPNTTTQENSDIREQPLAAKVV